MNHRSFTSAIWIAAVLFLGGLASGETAQGEDGATTKRATAEQRRRDEERGEETPRWDERQQPEGLHGRRGREADRRLTPKGARHDGAFGRPGHGGREHRAGAEVRKLREQIAERLEVLQQINPEVAERIQRHMDKRGGMNPERIRMMLGEQFQRIDRLLHLKRDDPDAFELAIDDLKLDRKTQELAEELRRAGGDIGDHRDQLRALIGRHFDVRQRKYEHELNRLEKRIAQLRRQLKTRRNHREALEQSRFDELVSTTEHPEW